jgi:hypothetical protein
VKKTLDFLHMHFKISVQGELKPMKMEHFRSILPPITYPFQLSYADHFLGVGSCFVEEMGQRLRDLKFSIQFNPQGIVFNPASVALSLERMLVPKIYQAEELFQHQGLWHSFDHHGRFSSPSSEDTLHHIYQAQSQGQIQLQKASVLMLTLGSANVWQHLTRERIVSNCHKLPGSMFQRKRLSVAEIVETLSKNIQEILILRPAVNIILTVSPVRYLREGLLENTRSKATLLLAVEQLCQQFDRVHYFPAYELVMDDLRDYRFYAEDLAHPSSLATHYIWDYFKQSFFAPEVLNQLQDLEKLKQASLHRPLRPESASHQQFIAQQLEYIQRLEHKYPEMDFSVEKNIFNHQLKA